MKISVHLRNPRSCGTCSLCCTVMGVAELNKDVDTRCELLTPLGRCSVYGEHPASCQEFKCLWLNGSFPVELRPDKIQAVPMATAEGDKIVLNVAPGAGRVWERGQLRAFIEKMAQDGTYTMARQGGEYYAVTLPEGIPDDAALLFDEISIDGKTSQLVQIKRAPKRGGK